MDNNTFYYHGLPIENDGDDMFPYFIPTLARWGKKCRFRTLPAAKAAITRFDLELAKKIRTYKH